MSEIRPLAAHEVPEAGRLLGRAFADNPGYLAALSRLTAAARARVVTDLHTSFCAAAARHWSLEGLFAGERLVGAMIVLPPGGYPPTLRAKLTALRGALGAGPRGWLNLARIDAHMVKRHPRAPHHYLFILGVDPAQQGRGHGRTLLQALSARADASGHPCYLETDRDSSVRLYRSVGYRVLTDEAVAAVADLRMWTMRRDPVPVAG